MTLPIKYYVYFRGFVWGGFETTEDARRFVDNRWFRGFTNYKIFESDTGQVPGYFRDKIELGQTVQINYNRPGMLNKYKDLPLCQIGEVVSTKDYPICQVRLSDRKYYVSIHSDNLTRITEFEPSLPVAVLFPEGY